MKNIKSYFIAQTQHLIDIDRGGNRQFTEPQILGVYRTLDEAKAALDAIDAGYGKVLEIRNPIQVGESIMGLPPREHEWERTPPKKAARSRKAKAA